MWVYPETQNTPVEEVESDLPALPAETACLERAAETAASASAQAVPSPEKKHDHLPPKRFPVDCWLLAAAFLIGGVAAGVLQARCNESEREILQYYLNSWSTVFSVTAPSGAAALFRTEYITLVLFSSLMLLLGFSAFGSQLVFLLMLLYGMGNGILLVQLCTGAGWKTVLVIVGAVGIPAALAEGILCLFGASALRMSGKLQRSVFHREQVISFGAGTLLARYLFTLVVFAPLCGLCTGLSFLIAGI